MLLTAALILAQANAAPVTVWEKLVQPGVTYRMEVDSAPPRLINAVRLSPTAAGLVLVGELAGGGVFDPSTPSKGRETVTALALRSGSVVAVNADYFPFTGDPLGAMVKDGELISAPTRGRAAFAWGPSGARAAYLEFSATVKFEGRSVAIQGLNQECGDDSLVLYTDKAGFAVSPVPATTAVLTFSGTLAPSGSWKAKVKRMVASATTVPLQPGEAALTYRGNKMEPFTFLSPGDEVEVSVACTGLDWAEFPNVIAGGPYLVKEGKAFMPYKEEGFTEAFAKNRHPRTAIGRTKEGDLWIVTIDGRQSMSAGATLSETADVMVRLGCVEAVNLDGGGSTTLNLHSVTVNRPSEGAERPIANALLVLASNQTVGGSTPVDGQQPVIAGPASVRVGATARYRLVGLDGDEVPNGAVLWSAQGGAWIDQAGLLRGSAEGACRILVYYAGRTVTLTVKIEG